MSKELVISAASHERRVAILEEGQLVEIYIEREKEFALVGSIYKGKVTRVLPGMQSAFVDIGLDGDAFLYVSDVFENLEDYDHGHSHSDQPAAAPAYSPAPSNVVELLPGETLSHASSSLEEEAPSPEFRVEEASHESFPGESSHRESLSHDEQPGAAEEHAGGDEIPDAHLAEAHDDSHSGHAEERQPDSNASAPQNFSPHYNPTQNYAPRSDRGSDRGGQDYGRGGDRGSGGDRGRGGRWGRRGGRHRGGRPQGPGAGGRNLPPSKYASPQGGEPRGNDSRGYDNRGYDNRGRDQRGSENRGGQPRGFEPRGPAQRGFDHRPPESAGSSSSGAVAEEPILLPGESLAKYRGKPAAAPPPPLVEPESAETRPEVEETTSRTPSAPSAPVPATGPAGGNVPRRFSGGLPRWVLAEAGAETEAARQEDHAEEQTPSSFAAPAEIRESELAASAPPEPIRPEVELSEEQAVVLSSELVEAKHEETSDHAKADALVGGAEFDEEEEAEQSNAATETDLSEEEEAEEEERQDQEQQEEERQEEAQLDAAEDQAAAESELSEEETADVEARRAADRAEFAANAAHESAEHVVALGDSEHIVLEPAEPELIEASAGEPIAGAAIIEEDVILLPGETRSPRVGGPSAPREDFPRDSARIGGNPRARFQRPMRGGRDRGRGGRPDSRGG
ncbi:MAG: hypothetical protein WA542_03710, partial [Candidatus Acidiferrum sp.]